MLPVPGSNVPLLGHVSVPVRCTSSKPSVMLGEPLLLTLLHFVGVPNPRRIESSTVTWAVWPAVSVATLHPTPVPPRFTNVPERTVASVASPTSRPNALAEPTTPSTLSIVDVVAPSRSIAVTRAAIRSRVAVTEASPDSPMPPLIVSSLSDTLPLNATTPAVLLPPTAVLCPGWRRS